jgi:hypothetical protein
MKLFIYHQKRLKNSAQLDQIEYINFSQERGSASEYETSSQIRSLILHLRVGSSLLAIASIKNAVMDALPLC